MKNIIKSVLLVATIGLVMSACKKDQNKAVLSYTNASATLTASSTATIVPDSNTREASAVVLSWDSVNFGYHAAITYTLQFDIPSDSFNLPQTVVVTGYNYTCTQGFIDTIANTVGMINGVVGTMSVRLSATVTQISAGTSEVTPVYSNTISLNVNPYYIPIPITYEYVPGAYQGWAPGTAPELGSQNNINFEGFVAINASGSPSLAFKVTSAADWDHNNYGDAGGLTTSGNVTNDPLSATGANIIIPNAGYFFIQNNASTLALTLTQIDSFTMVGSATGGSPIQLAYDSTKMLWFANNVSLSAGTFDYVGGAPTSISIGQGSKDSYHVAVGSKTQITVPTAGNYNVKLVLTSPRNYTDTLTKL